MIHLIVLFPISGLIRIEFFDGTQIECKVNMPEEIPFHEISGDKRRNIFLCVKESLNNALKHSKASRIKIDIEVNHKLEIKIADNGVGIEQEKIRRFGNGLKNIERRMKGIGGSYTSLITMALKQNLNCHYDLSSFFIAARNKNNHPAIKATPPNGVIMPALSRETVSAALPAVSKYKDPEKRIIPIINNIPAILANF